MSFEVMNSGVKESWGMGLLAVITDLTRGSMSWPSDEHVYTLHYTNEMKTKTWLRKCDSG